MNLTRVLTLSLLLVCMLAGLALGANQVAIYVPAGAGHADQELIVGVPGEIHIAVTNDVEVQGIGLTMAWDNAAGPALWPLFEESNVEFVLPEPILPYVVTSTQSIDGVWPDTVAFGLLSFLGGAEYLAPGTHLIMKITVTPTGVGTVSLMDLVHKNAGRTQFVTAGGTIFPDYLALDINIVTITDCNDNGIPDEQDLTNGTSFDCNSNGILDECDIDLGVALDCNANGIPDECDLESGFSFDCNGNGLADECDIATGYALDCNENGVPDLCDLDPGDSEDCNSNGIPDECDPDADHDGIPDDCELETSDCNYNGIADAYDISTGHSNDVNTNSVPDECEGLAGNYFQLYVAAGPGNDAQTLVVGRTGNLVLAVVTDTDIITAAVSYQYTSGDGSPMWPVLVEGDVTFPAKTDPADMIDFFDHRQGGLWPDTLTMLQSLFGGGSLTPGFHPLAVMAVTPTQVGQVNFESAPVPNGYAPPQIVTYPAHDVLTVPLIAPPVTITANCCVGLVGDVNYDDEEEPSIGDIAALVDFLFITRGDLVCLAEADINQSGGDDPLPSDVTIADIAALIEYLFIGGADLPSCF